MIRVMIVHDVRLISDLLTTVLESKGTIKVVGQAATLDEALAILATTNCHLAVVNSLLPDAHVLQLIRTIAKQCNDVKIVIVGLVESQTAIVQCFEAGAAGYVLESEGVAQLMAVVSHAAVREALISPAIAAALIARVSQLKQLATELNGYDRADMAQQATKLTEREESVLAMLGEGCSNRDIAEELVITIGTVKNHVHNILEKLDVHTRRQAAMVARQLALGEKQAENGVIFTWPDAMGLEIASRRVAAAML